MRRPDKIFQVHSENHNFRLAHSSVVHPFLFCSSFENGLAVCIATVGGAPAHTLTVRLAGCLSLMHGPFSSLSDDDESRAQCVYAYGRCRVSNCVYLCMSLRFRSHFFYCCPSSYSSANGDSFSASAQIKHVKRSISEPLHPIIRSFVFHRQSSIRRGFVRGMFFEF